MSGKLVILPKKSWHVGSRENVARVLRDEENARETARGQRAARQAQERRSLFARLKAQARPLQGGGGEEEQEEEEEDREDEKVDGAELKANEMWRRPRQQHQPHQFHHQQQQQQQASAKALGWPLNEAQGREKAWHQYVTVGDEPPLVSARSGQTLDASEAEQARAREQRRQQKEDPMARFLVGRPPAIRPVTPIASSASSASNASIANSTMRRETAGQQEQMTRGTEAHATNTNKRSKKSKKSKRDKRDKKDKKDKKKSRKTKQRTEKRKAETVTPKRLEKQERQTKKRRKHYR